jgi:hypothetical protein
MATEQSNISNEFTTGQETPPSLTIQDLVTAAQIVQLSSQRGTFRAEELADVGNFYNKLVKFLQVSGALTPVPQGENKND